MKIEVPKVLDTANLVGNFETKKASLDESSIPFMLRMLSENFYSNPIDSIVREITSNCFDSHIEAEVDDAVRIKMYWDEEGEYISFIDVGVGLSPDRIDKIFMNYFSSTKRDTNDLIGGFGLGSKSPLSYQDHFYIFTNFDSIRYQYIYSKGEERPELDLLTSDETTERNGTEIRIYIKEENGDKNDYGSDWNKFVISIKTQLSYFDNVYIDIPYTEIDNEFRIYDATNFKFRSGDTYNDEMHICFEKVSYPIDWDAIDRKRIATPVGIKFKIGELTVTPNREALRYTDEVVALIQERLVKVIDELTRIYSDQDKVYTDFKEYWNVKDEHRVITFRDANGNEDNLRIKHLPKLEKKRTFQPLEHTSCDYDNDPVSACFKVIGETSDGKQIKNISGYYSSRNLTNLIVEGTTNYVVSLTGTITMEKCWKHPNAYIITPISSAVAKKEVKDYAVKTIHSKIKDFYTDYNQHYFDLGIAKRNYDYTKFFKKFTIENLEDFDVPLTDDERDLYLSERRSNDKSLQRRLSGEISVKELSSHNGRYDLKLADLDNYKGVVLYGFREDTDELLKVITFMNQLKTFRAYEMVVDSYLTRVKRYDNKQLNSKACMVLQIAQNVEKHFKPYKKMTHVKNIYSNNVLFKRVASSFRIEDYFRKGGSFDKYNAEEFVSNMRLINEAVADLLQELLDYRTANANDTEGMYFTRYSRNDIRTSIMDLAKDRNLFDPIVLEKFKRLDAYFKDVEIIKYTEFTSETLPHILTLLRTNKKKINLEYYQEVVPAKKKVKQIELEFPTEEEKITKFQSLTQTA